MSWRLSAWFKWNNFLKKIFPYKSIKDVEFFIKIPDEDII
jgi:hypothetical protein